MPGTEGNLDIQWMMGIAPGKYQKNKKNSLTVINNNKKRISNHLLVKSSKFNN